MRSCYRGFVPKLTVVVTCTERKTPSPAAHMQVRTLDTPIAHSAARAAEWIDRVRSQPALARVELHKMYQGEAWAQAKLLAQEAASKGYDVQVLVASAGLGLQHIESLAVPYSATFAMNHVDSVATNTSHARAWWKQITSALGTGTLAAATGHRGLLVLSESYAKAMHDDLSALGERGGDLLMIGGAGEVVGIPRIPSDRSLRPALGGTTTSVTLRIARSWLSVTRLSPTQLVPLHDPDSERHWKQWAHSVRREEIYNRTRTDDTLISSLINEMLAADQSLSATRALRRLRDSGFACEQGRFRELYKLQKVAHSAKQRQ